MTTVYLAGGINGLSDADARDWREYAKARLTYDTLDPMRRDFRGAELGAEDEIVEGDLEDIAASDVVLANCVWPSWGTAMEVHYADQIGVPVFAYVGLREASAISPWLRYFATALFQTLDEAIDALNEAIPPRVVVDDFPPQTIREAVERDLGL